MPQAWRWPERAGVAELVVALDVPDLSRAQALLDRLEGIVTHFKVGLELFTAAGPPAVALVRERGGTVVLDLKLHDIPHTVAGAVRAAARLGVSYLTVHLAGGEAMVRAAVAAAGEAGGMRLLGVTRLTSEPLPRGQEGEYDRRVQEAARRAAALGVDGVVVAVREVGLVRAACPAGFLTLTPGVRPRGWAAEDQQRVATPAEAAQAGADLVVVGRPIVQAGDPLAAARAVLEDLRLGTATVG